LSAASFFESPIYGIYFREKIISLELLFLLFQDKRKERNSLAIKVAITHRIVFQYKEHLVNFFNPLNFKAVWKFASYFLSLPQKVSKKV
jgi:hypothetical protein